MTYFFIELIVYFLCIGTVHRIGTVPVPTVKTHCLLIYNYPSFVVGYHLPVPPHKLNVKKTVIKLLKASLTIFLYFCLLV